MDIATDNFKRYWLRGTIHYHKDIRDSASSWAPARRGRIHILEPILQAQAFTLENPLNVLENHAAHLLEEISSERVVDL